MLIKCNIAEAAIGLNGFGDLFDESMVLLNDVIQILDLSHSDFLFWL